MSNPGTGGGRRIMTATRGIRARKTDDWGDKRSYTGTERDRESEQEREIGGRTQSYSGQFRPEYANLETRETATNSGR